MQEKQGIHWWTAILAAILAALVIAWTHDIHFLNSAGNPGESVPPAIPVIVALLLGGGLLFYRKRIPGGLKRLLPRTGLGKRDIFFIFAVLLVAAPTAGVALMHRFVVLLTIIPFSASPHNGMLPFAPLIPPFWTPGTGGILDPLYMGLERIDSPIPWEAWVIPIFFWTFFFTLFFFCLLCLVSMLRKQWVDRERLVFPLAAIPIEFTRPRKGEVAFYLNRLFWLGALLSVLFFTFKVLNHYIEFFPGFHDTIDLFGGITQRPWIVLRQNPSLSIKISLTVIGLAYLIKQEISLSIWVTIVAVKLLQLGVAAMGFNVPSFPNLSAQAPGAFLAFSGFLIWLARGQLKEVFLKAIGRRPDLDDSDEPLSYRVSFFGFIGGTLLLCGMLQASGMNFLLALLVFLFLYVMALTYARFRAEAGSPYAWGTPWAGIGFASSFVLFTGTGWFTMTDRMLLSILNIFTIGFFPLLIATQMEVYKMADGVGMKRRDMSAALMGGVMLAIPLAFVLILKIFYTRGANFVAEYETLVLPQQAQWAKAMPPQRDWLTWFWPAIGAVVTLVLVVLRFVFLRFPLHPLGYVIMMTRAGHFMVGSIFLAWLIKKAVLKYGGVTLFRKLVPFFIGLVIGELGAVGLWFILVRFIPGIPYLVAWG